MATILDLAHRNELHKIIPKLSRRKQEERSIYVSSALKEWILRVLPTKESDWKLELSPLEQFAALANDFAAGQFLTYKLDFLPLRHVEDGIWELKTGDLRLFGWFPAKDCFIAHRLEMTTHIKEHKLYFGMAGEVATYRNNLELDEPKFISGVNPNDVVSNFHF